MGDFFLDCRPQSERRAVQAAELLRFTSYTRIVVHDEPAFALVTTLTEDPALWGAYRDQDGTLIAFAGRVALPETDWQAGEVLPGPGGVAAKALFQHYRNQGLASLEKVSGNCVIFVFEPGSRELHLITDCMGAFPAFEAEGGSVFSSHPDVLARATGNERDLDEVSLTEFLLTSTVTPPFTYYRRIRSLEQGTVTTIRFAPQGTFTKTTRRYFDMAFQSNGSVEEEDLADELAQALHTAVRHRTLPRLGRTAVALSGGLDSRAILACLDNRDGVLAFTLFNEPNRELQVAENVAGALGVSFHPWKREFDYYGDNAELGVRISGGMGTFANNHFLGVIDRLRGAGVQNLLTGCYCDYLFKGLPLNRNTHWLTGREQIAPFRHEFYFAHFSRSYPLLSQVRDRWHARVPAEFQRQDSDAALFQVEARRTFPLCYEGDNEQRVVPQRVGGWYLPVADRAVLDVYCRVPARFKLNRSVFSKAVQRLCGGPLARVPDANTGVAVGASALRERVSGQRLRIARKLRGLRRTIGNDGSWPDWQHYVAHSPKLTALWKRPNPAAVDFFQRTVGARDLRPTPADYQGDDLWFFVSLLTLKLWFEQWHS